MALSRHSNRNPTNLGLSLGQPGGLYVGMLGGAILVVIRVLMNGIRLRSNCFLWPRGKTCE